MTNAHFHTLAGNCGCRSVREFSRLMLGDEWTAARYDTIRRMVAAGELTGWPAALVAAHARIAELEKELEAHAASE